MSQWDRVDDVLGLTSRPSIGETCDDAHILNREINEKEEKRIDHFHKHLETRIFTFGSGQAYNGYYVKITTARNNHREIMVRLHGQHWCGEYYEDQLLGLDMYKCLLIVKEDINGDLHFNCPWEILRK